MPLVASGADTGRNPRGPARKYRVLMPHGERTPSTQERQLVRADPVAPLWRVVGPDGRPRGIRVLTAVSPALSERFEAVARALRGVAHPNLVDVLDVLDVDGRPAALTAFPAGPTARAWLHAERRPVHEILRVFVGVARGLSAVHRAGVVHGHVESGRIVLDPELLHLLPKIDDVVLGRPATPDGVHADLVALGCLLRELLAGPSSGERRTDVPPALERLVASLTAPAPDPFLVSVDLVLDHLQREPPLLALLPPSSRPTQLQGSGPTLLPTRDVEASLAPSRLLDAEAHEPVRAKPPRRTRWIIAAFAVVALGAGAGTVAVVLVAAVLLLWPG